MRHQILIPDIINDLRMIGMYPIIKCECSRFYIRINENDNAYNKCGACNQLWEYSTYICDSKGNIINNVYNHVANENLANDKKIHNDDDNLQTKKRKKDISCTILFKRIRKQVKKQYPNRKWKITLVRFENQMLNCYMCGNNLVDNEKLEFSSYFINDSIDEITPKNLNIVCNICNRMIKSKTCELLYMKASNITNKQKKNDQYVEYNNAFANGSCHLKFESFSKLKKEQNIPFEITEEDYINYVSDACKYCCRKATTANINDIVIMERDLGYVINNCISCCEDCKILRSRMSNNKFISHMEKIFLNSKVRPIKEKQNKIYIASKYLRFYSHFHNDIGVPIDLMLTNLRTNFEWSIMNNNSLTNDGEFFKITCSDIPKGDVKSDVLYLDNGCHQIPCLGMSQSDVSQISMNNFNIDCDDINYIDDVTNNIKKYTIVNNNGDIIIRIPLQKNRIAIKINMVNEEIIEFSMHIENMNLPCNCIRCSEHSTNIKQKCLCNLCISHMMHDKRTCSCRPNNKKINEHFKINLIAPKTKNIYSHERVELKNLAKDKCKIIVYKRIDQDLAVIKKKSIRKQIGTIGMDAYKKNNNDRMKQINKTKIKEIGKKEYNNKKKEYMKKYRNEKKICEGVEKKVAKTSGTRKHEQRAKMIERYGNDKYKKIVALETKYFRLKRAGKTKEQEIVKNELSQLKKE
jgi:hypothetical protein